MTDFRSQHKRLTTVGGYFPHQNARAISIRADLGLGRCLWFRDRRVGSASWLVLLPKSASGKSASGNR